MANQGFLPIAQGSGESSPFTSLTLPFQQQQELSSSDPESAEEVEADLLDPNVRANAAAILADEGVDLESALGTSLSQTGSSGGPEAPKTQSRQNKEASEQQLETLISGRNTTIGRDA